MCARELLLYGSRPASVKPDGNGIDLALVGLFLFFSSVLICFGLICSGYSPLGEAQYWYMHAAAMFETYLEILGVDMHVSFF